MGVASSLLGGVFLRLLKLIIWSNILISSIYRVIMCAEAERDEERQKEEEAPLLWNSDEDEDDEEGNFSEDSLEWTTAEDGEDNSHLIMYPTHYPNPERILVISFFKLCTLYHGILGINVH